MHIQNQNLPVQSLVFNDDKSLVVPGCMLYSRGGLVPHLTKENLEIITKEKRILCQIPLATIYQQPGVKVMEEYGESFHNFSSSKANLFCEPRTIVQEEDRLSNNNKDSKDDIFILNTNDSYLKRPDLYSYNEEKSISIWAPGGRRKISPEEYMNIFTTFQFDVCVPPSDNIPGGCTKKRCFKSVSRTIKFLDKCLQIKHEKKLNSPIIGVIEGGDNLFEREKCAKEVAQRDVDGYLLSGFDRLSINWKELLQKCLVHLDKNKLSILSGIFTPYEVLEGVEMGVHLFDTVIAYNATERNCALCFKYNTKKKHVNSVNIPIKFESPRLNNKESMQKTNKDFSEYEYDLTDKKYVDDNSPVVEGCSCYCCSRYVRAYLHHLVVTKEMLAQVLLMMHNLHHWLSFFDEIQRCLREDSLADLKELVTVHR